MLPKNSPATRFPNTFYLQSPLTVAQQLLGAHLYTCRNGELTVGIIVETEVYRGACDKASHAYPNKHTPRTAIMFAPGGRAYVYRIYGRYDQFCVVTSPTDIPDVVFIRALEPTEGIAIMQRRRGTATLRQLTTGPGKLCLALGITRDLYGADLRGDTIWLAPSPVVTPQPGAIGTSPRIGIAYAEEDAALPWRFFIKSNPFVSRP